MKFTGRVYKDGKFWLAEVPIFAALTEGRTKKQALDMIVDWFETMADEPGFALQVLPRGNEFFEVGSSDLKTMIRLLLRRRREASGLSLADVAERLGASSRNAYARYESGKSVPTLGKLEELLQAVSPLSEFLIEEAPADYGKGKLDSSE